MYLFRRLTLLVIAGSLFAVAFHPPPTILPFVVSPLFLVLGFLALLFACAPWDDSNG